MHYSQENMITLEISTQDTDIYVVRFEIFMAMKIQVIF
jgi:hypothetical protein